MELLFRMRSENAAGETNVIASKLGTMPSASIESLIIIDRDIDFATLLLTPLTYEGLVDELFGIRDNQAEIDSSIVGPPPGAGTSSKNPPPIQQQSLKRKIQLDASDKVYRQIRDTNIAISGRHLNQLARRLDSERKSLQAKNSTSELKDFISRIPQIQAEEQSLRVHTGIAEEIKKYTNSEIFGRTLEVQQNLAEGTDASSQHDTIEELISRDVPLKMILRLLCLESCMLGGLRPKDLDQFKRLILQAYGYQHLLTFDALEKMQLLYARSGSNVLLIPNPMGGGTAEGVRTNYAHLRKSVRLIVEEVNEQDPDDIAYVYSGYAPLSVRLVQCILQKQYLLSFTKAASASNGISSAAQGWQGFEDVLKNVKGATFNRIQRGEDHAVKTRHMLAGTGGMKTVVLMFLGGITFTEIAALRFVAKQEEGRRRILICTTDIIGGNGVVEAAIEKGDFGKG